MKKISDGYYRFDEQHALSEGGVQIHMVIDRIDEEDLDTQVDIGGTFCIAGNTRHEFVKKLETLIGEYRI